MTATPTPPQYPEPQWSAAPQQSGSVLGGLFKGVIGRIIGILVVAAVVGGGYLAYQAIVNPDKLGQVVFTTDAQTGTGPVESKDACKVNHTVTSVKAGTPVWSVYIWTSQLSSTDVVHEEDFKDGVSIFSKDWDTSGTGGTDCVWVTDDLSQEWTAAGVYEIKLTVGDKVVADGKLTITE
jgi:hypothetical protein